jgi:RimJ/RimL family protein N-acetyltransferase
MSTLPELIPPTTAVCGSYLAGERQGAIEDDLPSDLLWLDGIAADFPAFVARRVGVRQQWGVPVTELWFVDVDSYIGTVVIRHHLTPALENDGGHIGFNVVPGRRRQGHATEMLAAALPVCRDLGLTNLLITAAIDNVASRRVIEANGGVLQSTDTVARYILAI